jgi:hypothetical protein
VVNQILEQYLHIYCSYHQSDWLTLLPLAEFAYNNPTNAQSNATPFFACTGMHPVFDPLLAPASLSLAPAEVDHAHKFLQCTTKIKTQLQQAQTDYSCLPTLPLRVGDLVFLE